MGEVKKEDILEILAGYDKSEITIATLGSHTSHFFTYFARCKRRRI